ncbi:hypothetical protein FOA52_008470, partial [Chlamydomonas sp. UWO 241]
MRAGYTVEPDYPLTLFATPNDDRWTSISAAMSRISAPAAWDLTTGSSAANSPIVCIIDTGINYGHPDLAANVHPNKGFNAITGLSGTACNDDNSHGSHCAGTIGAIGNNGQGVAGVQWSARMLGCKFMDSQGSGYTSDAVECVRYCREQGAKITSNSWGGGGFSQALYDEIAISNAAGHLFIAAAGNDNANTDTSASYPSNYALANVISVGASDDSDARASFSNYGATTVDLFAPGVGITSTVLGSAYASYSGTSMATPHVAGAAALIWGYNPSLTAADVKRILMASVDPIAGLKG